MQIHAIDLTIIVVYMIGIVIAGLLLSRKAAQNMDSYFLGGKSVPWYLLGISNASGNFDITGTMWMVSILFMYGLKSVWLPWVWPQFHPIIMMVFLSIWLRRSNVLTGAEWIRTRFGNEAGAELSHISVAIFALISTIGMLAYAFVGIGKFSAAFFPWDISFALGNFTSSTANTYALIFMSITACYVVLGGMYSVVLTDIIQFVILTICSFFIAGIAIARTSREQIMASVPAGGDELFFKWKLDIDWSNLMPNINNQISGEYTLFGAFFMMMLFKGLLNSMAGPSPNYDMQRVLAAKNPKEAALMSWSNSVVLLIPRYCMIAGITVRGLVFFRSDLNAMGANVDIEQVLPYVITNFIPVGLIGFLMAGLLAAFMSTFDSTVNAGAAYLVNDVYKRYINPNAPDKTYIKASYIASLGLVAVGIVLGYKIGSIDSILRWITIGLWGGYAAPNVLKWYWYRLNGFGYFFGMIAGIVAAVVIAIVTPIIWPSMTDLQSFPIIFILSLLGSVVGSLLTKPTNDQTLKSFYTTVRPWGFWKPVYKMVIKDDPEFKKNTAFKRDMVNVLVGIIWQTSMVVIPIYFIIRDFKPGFVAVAVLIVTSVFLKKNWYPHLGD